MGEFSATSTRHCPGSCCTCLPAASALTTEPSGSAPNAAPAHAALAGAALPLLLPPGLAPCASSDASPSRAGSSSASSSASEDPAAELASAVPGPLRAAAPLSQPNASPLAAPSPYEPVPAVAAERSGALRGSAAKPPGALAAGKRPSLLCALAWGRAVPWSLSAEGLKSRACPGVLAVLALAHLAPCDSASAASSALRFRQATKLAPTSGALRACAANPPPGGEPSGAALADEAPGPAPSAAPLAVAWGSL